MSAPSPNELSNLCLACGICCSGAVFTHVVLEPTDKDRLQQAGHELSDDITRLNLPCRFLNGNACAAYQDRPHVCSAYRCETLIAAQTGKMTLSEAREKMASIAALKNNFIDTIPDGMDFSLARQLVSESVPSAGLDKMKFNAMRLAFVALQTGIDRHIRPAGTEVVHTMPAAPGD